jgi:hypothetical protein
MKTSQTKNSGLTPRDFLLLAMSAHNCDLDVDELQKHMYFVTEILKGQGIKTGFLFPDGFYGPRCGFLDEELGALFMTGLVSGKRRMLRAGNPLFGGLRCSYELTDDGANAAKWLREYWPDCWDATKASVDALCDAKAHAKARFPELCLAAKLHAMAAQIVNREHMESVANLIMRRWGLCANNGEIESAIQFLEALRPNLPVIKNRNTRPIQPHIRSAEP